MKKYILIDTNNLVNFFESGFRVIQGDNLRSGEDSEILELLLDVLNKNKVHIILPEVVMLECQRILLEKKGDLEKIYERYTLAVQTSQNPYGKKRLSEKVEHQVVDLINKLCLEEKLKIDKAGKLLDKIFSHKNSHRIKINNEIFIAAYRRGLNGEKPFNSIYDPGKENKPIHDIQPDCLIVESARYFLKNKNNYEMILCTNDSDYFTSLDKNEIDPRIRKDVNVKRSFVDLSTLLEKEFKLKLPKRTKKIKKVRNLDLSSSIGSSVNILKSDKVSESKVSVGKDDKELGVSK